MTHTHATLLRITPAISEGSAPYNQFSLALSDRQHITICTYFAPEIPVPETVRLFPGDGSLTGFFRVLRRALDAGDYDIAHAHLPSVSFLFLAGAMRSDRRLIRSSVHTVHSSYPNYKLRNRLLLLPIFALYRRIVFCSHSSFESFPRLYRALAAHRTRIIQNGADLDRIDHAIEGNLESSRRGRFTIATVGRLIGLKKPMSILSAFHQAALRGSELIFIGDGELRSDVLAESRRLGLQDQVQVGGWMEREEVYRHLVTADLLVSSSTVEGLPVAVLEAMACRCPVLLSDIPPHREITEGCDFIPLVPPGDAAGFAQEMRRFREMTPTERAAIGEACRQWVEARFSLTTMLARYEEVYLDVMYGD